MSENKARLSQVIDLLTQVIEATQDPREHYLATLAKEFAEYAALDDWVYRTESAA